MNEGEQMQYFKTCADLIVGSMLEALISMQDMFYDYDGPQSRWGCLKGWLSRLRWRYR